jgi:hypothetical protein
MSQKETLETEPFKEKEARILHKLDMKIILYFLLLFATIIALLFFIAWFSFNAGFEKASEMCFQGTLKSVLKTIPCS